MSLTSLVLCKQTLHQQWLHTRACYKNHRSATIMVISLSLRLWTKSTAPLAKLPHGGSYLFTKYDVSDKMQNFFKESSWSALSRNCHNWLFHR